MVNIGKLEREPGERDEGPAHNPKRRKPVIVLKVCGKVIIINQPKEGK